MRHFCGCLALLLFLLKGGMSQELRTSKIEVGGGFSFFRIGQFGQVLNYSGMEGRFVYNVNSTFSFDSAISFYPSDFKEVNQINVQQGGRAFLAEFGLKGGIRRRRVGIFGLIRPGLVSFSRVRELNSPDTERRSSFFVDLGGALETYPSERTIVFLEASAPLIMFGQRTEPLGGGATVFAPGKVESSLHMSTGVRFRLGRIAQEGPRGPSLSLRRYELGLLFSSLSLERFLSTLKHEPGVGARGSYDMTRNLALDAEVSYFPRDPRSVSAQEGGKMFLGVFGPKAGIRNRSAGLFAKARPGFLRYSQTLADDSDPMNPRYSPLTHFALDLGGVFELYPSETAVLRLDVGDTILWYRSRTVPGFGSPLPAFTRHTLQLSTGVAFRF